jgi:hypothetical protein
MFIGGNSPVLSLISSGVGYFAAGTTILLMLWDVTHPDRDSKRRRLVSVWLLVIMSAALAVNLLNGQPGYSAGKRIVIEVLFAIVLISACAATYRAGRRGANPKNLSKG